MLTLITYDISDNKKRTRLAKHLKQYGLRRIQYSGFVGELNPNDRIILTKELKQFITPVDEKIREKEKKYIKQKKRQDSDEGTKQEPGIILDEDEIPKADSIYVIPLCERCMRLCRIVSDQELSLTESGDVTIVG